MQWLCSQVWIYKQCHWQKSKTIFICHVFYWSPVHSLYWKHVFTHSNPASTSNWNSRHQIKAIYCRYVKCFYLFFRLRLDVGQPYKPLIIPITTFFLFHALFTYLRNQKKMIMKLNSPTRDYSFDLLYIKLIRNAHLWPIGTVLKFERYHIFNSNFRNGIRIVELFSRWEKIQNVNMRFAARLCIRRLCLFAYICITWYHFY